MTLYPGCIDYMGWIFGTILCTGELQYLCTYGYSTIATQATLVAVIIQADVFTIVTQATLNEAWT